MNEELFNTIKKARERSANYKLNTAFSFSFSSNGEKYGKGTGSSLEFLDHREYFPGDDIRNIDWKAVAKYEKPVVKLFKNEVAPVVEIIIDCSESMNLSESGKYLSLWGLVELLSIAAINSGCSVVKKTIKAICRNMSSVDIEKCSEDELQCDYCGDAGLSLVSYPPKFKPQSIRILVSDLFWNVDPNQALRAVSKGSAATVVIQLVSEQDENPDLIGNLKLIDSETKEFVELMVNSDIKKQYLKKYDMHRDNWKNSCKAHGAFFAHVISEDFLSSFVPVSLFESSIIIPGAN